MPPKARFTRERIEEAAFQLAREKGLEAVAAREVAKSMGMTVTPIFTYFSGMDELKRSVKDRARREFVDYLRGSLDYFPAFKEFGMRWMRYAGENPNLYRILMGPEEGSASLEDLRALAEKGTEILTCGTCLNYYVLAEKLAVGGVTNMYAIVEKLANAGKVIKP